MLNLDGDSQPFENQEEVTNITSHRLCSDQVYFHPTSSQSERKFGQQKGSLSYNTS